MSSCSSTSNTVSSTEIIVDADQLSGGAIYIRGGSLSCNGCYFDFNTAELGGGDIFVANGGYLNTSDCQNGQGSIGLLAIDFFDDDTTEMTETYGNYDCGLTVAPTALPTSLPSLVPTTQPTLEPTIEPTT